MISDFHIVTITHNDLHVDELGNFVIPYESKDELYGKLHNLKSQFNLEELVYLNTCNRVTFLNYTYEPWSRDKVKSFFQAINPSLNEHQVRGIEKVVNVYTGEVAINHLFEVTSSIDSLVVGEREIFRQFREAYNACQQNGLTGDNLRLLEKYTVQTAKQVYEETKIGEKAISVVSLAMQKLLQRGLPTEARIIIVGAGETNTKLAKFLAKHNYLNATIYNRSIENTHEISQILEAPAHHLKDLADHPGGFDILVVCTGSFSSMIDVQMYDSLLQGEPDRKLVIDLSVPRNVDGQVIHNYDIDYVDIEQLRDLAEKNLNARRGEIVHAKKILRNKLEEFLSLIHI